MKLLVTLVRNIVILTFIMVLLDLMLPSGSFRRYLKMVYGLTVILVLITPLGDLFNQIPDFDLSFRQSQLDIEQQYLAAHAGNTVETSQREMILDVYGDRIKKEVIWFLEQDGRWQVSEVEVFVVSDYDAADFGQITGIQAAISISAEAVPEEESSIDNIRIDPVEITPLPDEKVTETMAPELAGRLAEYFMLEADRVEVKVISGTDNS